MNVVQKSISLEVEAPDEQIVGGYISTKNPRPARGHR